MADGFRLDDLRTIFARLKSAKWTGILIGGQAVNLYAQQFADSIEGLEQFQPLTSRDLDFHGGPRDAKRAMQVLGATGQVNDGSDPSPNAGVLLIPMGSGPPLVIYILTTIFGVSTSEVYRSCITWHWIGSGDELTVQVIHPLLLLESKLACLRSLNQTTRQDEKHVRLMVRIIHAWLEQQLGRPRDVYRAIERIWTLMVLPDGLSAYERQIELWDCVPFEAMKADISYTIFFERRLPQLVKEVDAKRG